MKERILLVLLVLFTGAFPVTALVGVEVGKEIAGTYKYEREGFGGSFTITLNADGTYTFYEGMLSSYIGGGTWSEYCNVVYMAEENGFDLQFMFGIDEGALVYLAGGSDAFPYVNVADGERFIRMEEGDETTSWPQEDLNEGKDGLFITLSVDGLGQVAYAETEEKLSFDEFFTYNSFRLDGPAVYVLGAKTEAQGWAWAATKSGSWNIFWRMPNRKAQKLFLQQAGPGTVCRFVRIPA